MKKFFLLAASFLLTLTACQNDEELISGDGSSQTITVTIPQNGTFTRAVADNFGGGASVNRCILEIYHENKLYKRIEKDVADKSATFNDLRLVAQQEYDFVFWADCATKTDNQFTDKYYTTNNSLKQISNKGDFIGNSDERDAFFAKETLTVNGAFNESITLKRPFGLLIVKTNDLNAIEEQALKPDGYKVAFTKMPNTFNALTGEVSGEATISYTATALAKTDGTLSMDFLWATDNESALVDFSMTFRNGNTDICTNSDFKNIPIRRNYKTNVSGNLLTKQGKIEVTIKPEFETPDIDREVTEVSTVNDVTEAIQNGATDIIVKNAPTAETQIAIPSLKDANKNKPISVTLPNTTSGVTFKYTEGEVTNPPAEVNITIPEASKVVVDLPKSTVTLNGTTYSEVEATTAENTLIVPEGTTVNKLTVKKGNVEIYGKVGDITFEENVGNVMTYTVGDVVTLKKAIALITQSKCKRIALTADIDLKGAVDNSWTPIDTENKGFLEFDGGNHTIRNLYVDNYTGHADDKGYYYGGLFYVLQGTVKDLTIDGATVTCHRGAALVGRMDHGTIKNCHIKNITVTGYQKVGGLIGYVNASTNKALSVIGCSVDQCAIKTTTPEKGLLQAGGLIGYLQSFDRNVLIEGNSVSGISLDKVYTAENAADKFHALEQYYSHAFIGTVANFSKQVNAYDNSKVELKNNTVKEQISGIPTCDRTDDYIGWWAGDYNTISYPYAPKVVVDGTDKDRWIEVKRVYEQLKAGGNITIYRTCDLTKYEKKEEITVETPTTLTIINNTISDKEVVTILTVNKQQIVNKSELTVKGPGTMSATDYIFMNENGATLTIESGTYTATKATDANGVVIYNQGTCNIKGGTFNGPGFTLMNTGNANMTIENGNVVNGNNPTGYALMAAGSSAKLTVKGGRIEAIQSIGGANVTISGGTILNDCKYYALYNEGGKTTITGGYFSGYPNMKDVYIAGGTVAIQGGYFEDNQTDAASGYVYKNKVQTIEGITYNYEVVTQ